MAGYRYPSTPPPSELTDTGFTGHKQNSYIKLIYMNARWYDPQIGRFVSADTIIPNPEDTQGYNRYSYGRNNPIIWVDPSGHSVEAPDDLENPDVFVYPLPSVETIQELAETFDIPPELLGAILQIIQTADYSTTGVLSNDLLEDYIFGSLSASSNPTFFHPPLNWPTKVVLTELLALASLAGKQPSPGS
ncbi:MAG: RHS repeat-associated core domain-containing protein [Microthrixaceae bacterium]